MSEHDGREIIDPEGRAQRAAKYAAWGKERGFHYIYMLCSPSNGDPFYVGITSNPTKRLRQHQRDRSSAASPAMRVYSPSWRWHTDASMVVVAKFDTREKAALYEQYLISSMGNRFGMWLLNRDHHKLRALWHRANPAVTEDYPCPYRATEEFTCEPDPNYFPHFDD